MYTDPTHISYTGTIQVKRKRYNIFTTLKASTLHKSFIPIVTLLVYHVITHLSNVLNIYYYYIYAAVYWCMVFMKIKSNARER